MKCTQGRKVGLTIVLQSISHNLSVDPFGVELPSIRWKKKREKRTWEKRNPGNVSVCGVCLGQKNIAQLIKVKERNAAQSFLAKLKKISHVRRCSDLLNLLERKKSSWQSAWKVKAPPAGLPLKCPNGFRSFWPDLFSWIRRFYLRFYVADMSESELRRGHAAAPRKASQFNFPGKRNTETFFFLRINLAWQVISVNLEWPFYRGEETFFLVNCKCFCLCSETINNRLVDLSMLANIFLSLEARYFFYSDATLLAHLPMLNCFLTMSAFFFEKIAIRIER